MNKDTDSEFRLFHETERQFDYFVLALTGALCAYIGEHLAPKALGWNPYTCEVCALVCLGVSGVFAFRKALTDIDARHSAFKESWHREQAARIGKGLDDPPESDPLFEYYRGHIDTADALSRAPWARSRLNFHFRNGTLLSGAVLLLLSKIWEGYM